MLMVSIPLKVLLALKDRIPSLASQFFDYAHAMCNECQGESRATPPALTSKILGGGGMVKAGVPCH